MSQNSVVLPTTGTVSGLQMTQATNNALDTIATMWSGASAPSSPIAGQIWYDTTNSVLKKRNAANTAWISLFQINETLGISEPAYSQQGTGFCNRIINGAMKIDQVNEGGSYTIPTNNTYTYTADQWQMACLSSTANAVTGQQVTTSPPDGFQYSLKTTVGTGASSVASTDYLVNWQPIEANNISDLGFGSAAAQPISISFWAKSSIAGTFAVAIQNEASNRSLIRTYTISSPNTWTFITLNNIPGDTAGSWVMNGAVSGMRLYFTIAVGSSYQTATTNAWLAGAYYASTSQTNTVLTTSGATFQVTGVMMNKGAFSLPFEKQPYQQDLLACQRYFFKTFPQGTAVAASAGISGGFSSVQGYGASSGNQGTTDLVFPCSMRATPTVTTYNPTTGANSQFRNITRASDTTALAANIQSSRSWSFTYTTAAGSAAGDTNVVNVTASARM